MACRIGTIEFARTALLAPMAGVADRAFRQLAMEAGAAGSVSEMVSAKGYVYAPARAEPLLTLADIPRPAGIQLFGADPVFMARAAAGVVEKFHPDWIDLNMGCPVPKVVNTGAGAALLRDPPLAAAIIRAVKAAVDIPVTVKMRLGWDGEQINAVAFARLAEASGADALCVHGRTRAQMYAPSADWAAIRAVKAAVGIPVIANGDVFSAADAARAYAETGADLVMVGRGAMGRPWIFREIRTFFETGACPPPPPVRERMDWLARQAALTVEYKGEKTALREMRGHAGWYLKGIPGAALLRQQASALATLADLEALMQAAIAAGDG